jgi:hypothetical protein
MRFFADRLDTFAWGMAAGWLVTYLSLTHERRTVKNVRKAVDYLASYHDLTPAKSRSLLRKDWATDEEVWEVYRRVREVRPGKIRPLVPRFEWSEVWRLLRMWLIGLPLKQDPTYLTAEVLLCTKVFGLTELHAWRTLWSGKTLDNIKLTLAAVTAEIAEERRRYSEREAAAKAAEKERLAKMFGGQDWFETELTAPGEYEGVNTETKNVEADTESKQFIDQLREAFYAATECTTRARMPEMFKELAGERELGRNVGVILGKIFFEPHAWGGTDDLGVEKCSVLSLETAVARVAIVKDTFTQQLEGNATELLEGIDAYVASCTSDLEYIPQEYVYNIHDYGIVNFSSFRSGRIFE